jgi:hypothetical protein
MPNHSSKPKRPRDINQLAKSIVDQATAEPPPIAPEARQGAAPEPASREKDPAAVSLGRRGWLKGGPARANKLTARERLEIGKRAAHARWGKSGNKHTANETRGIVVCLTFNHQPILNMRALTLMA